ncbi:unnamed protein product [Phaedon cochleariae]|uniref:Uncharacterized protein n=1 Tax=Phaedon cochleariae TaxID=80249 RepID=A0A9P0DNI9_PHACE|nr:unnamed protein product [Phaedon cochleariae]
MDHVNKTLHLSLKQDIKVLTETIENIAVDTDFKSWMFPTKKSEFVKEFINVNRVFEYGDTELYLELLVDRLYVGLRLVISHLQKTLNHARNDESAEDNIVIQKPRQITIGCCFLNLWKIVEALAIEMADDGNQTITIPRKAMSRTYRNGKTQTDNISLDKCDSCASAISCMKSLMDIFEESDDISIKKKIRPRIFDITQFGSMLHTTISVENSVKSLVAKLVGKQRENEELQMELVELRKESREKDGKISLCQQEVRVYKEKCRKNSVMISSLLEQREAFVKKNSEDHKEREELKERISRLNESSKTDEITIKNLKMENQKMTDHFMTSLNLQKISAHKISGLQKNIETLEYEQELISHGFRQFEVAIENLNIRLINISKCHSNTEYKIKTLNDGDWLENIPNMIVKFKVYKENVKEKIVEASIDQMENVPVIPKFQIKGNPLEDISRQMEENSEKIRQLNEENAKLQIIISRFKCIKK